jgi:retinol dehydrogenase-12
MDLHGKIAVVTGSNTGIGRVTAEKLAEGGATVVLANRSEEKTRPVLDAIAARGGKAEFLRLDLADFSSVRAAAASVVERHPSIDLLVNNAGLAGARGLTKDGFELTFGTNHLGPYLFTRLLLPAIERAAADRGHARIVNVASRAHYGAKGIDFGAQRQSTPSAAGFAEYGVSKLANVLFTKSLAARLPSTVHAYSLHPGVVASDVWRSVPWGLRHLIKLFMLTNEQGAATTLHCATSDAAANETGLYYDKSRPRTPSKLAEDAALADRLWVESAKWVGLDA